MTATPIRQDAVPAGRCDTTAQVVVTVGTDHHPFDRLVIWIDRWAALHPGTTSLVQRGTSTAPDRCRSVEYLPFADLRQAMDGASVVVSHGGPATIMDVRAAGHLPVVVPRRPDFGEHVDAHQVRFCRWMAGQGQVLLAEDELTLHRLLDDAMASPGDVRIDPRDPGVEAAVRRLGDLVDGLLMGDAVPRPPKRDADHPRRARLPFRPSRPLDR